MALYQVIYICQVEADSIEYMTAKYLPEEGLPSDCVSVKVVVVDESLEAEDRTED